VNRVHCRVPEGAKTVCPDVKGRHGNWGQQVAMAGLGHGGNTGRHGGTGQQQGSVFTLRPGPAMVEVVSVSDGDHL